MVMVFLWTRLRDDTTTLVIQWLNFLDKKFFRLNTLDDLRNISLVIGNDNKTAETKNGQLNFKDIKSAYYNGGHLVIPHILLPSKPLSDQVVNFLRSQAKSVLSNMIPQGPGIRTFGLSPFASSIINKLDVLLKAQNIGLEIPNTEVVSSKKDLIALRNSWGRIINKSLDDGLYMETEDILISGQRTEEVLEKDILQMDDYFFPSLVQQLIEKKFEIRVFFFQDKFYSIAIFTQKSSLSKVDSRNVETNNPPREVPYNLPEILKIKISKLMNELNLNYGSLDFIYTNDNQFVFLEVNPYGQYGFLSTSGNFYIEKEIAEFL